MILLYNLQSNAVGETSTINMSRNPTAAVNLFRSKTVSDVQQSLSLCVQNSDWQKSHFKCISLPTRTFLKMHWIGPIREKQYQHHMRVFETSSHVKVLQLNAMSHVKCHLKRHLTFPRKIDTRRQWSVGSLG